MKAKIEDKLHEMALERTIDGELLECHQIYWYRKGLINGYRYAHNRNFRILKIIIHKLIKSC